MDVDTADKSVKFFPHVAHYLYFQFLIGAAHKINYCCPYMVFKMAALCKFVSQIILVSKHTFSGARNSMVLFTIVSEGCFRVKRDF